MPVCLCVNVWVRSPILLYLSVPVYTGGKVCVCVLLSSPPGPPHRARPRAVCTCRSWWCPAVSIAPAEGRPWTALWSVLTSSLRWSRASSASPSPTQGGMGQKHTHTHAQFIPGHAQQAADMIAEHSHASATMTKFRIWKQWCNIYFIYCLCKGLQPFISSLFLWGFSSMVGSWYVAAYNFWNIPMNSNNNTDFIQRFN